MGSRRRSTLPAFRWRSVPLNASSEATSTPLMNAPLDCSGPLRKVGLYSAGETAVTCGTLRIRATMLLPVLDAVAGRPRHHVDVRHRSQQIALQRVAEPVGHGQRHHQRRHARRHAQHGDRGDHGDHRLLAVRAQITSGDEQLEATHSLSSSRILPIRSMGPSGRSSGNRITSRIEREPVRIIVSRSIPMPSPPVGGMP